MPALEELNNKLLKLQHKKIETRSFMFLDIIAWLESKIKNIPVQKIVHRNWQKHFKTND